jgi:endo-1,4-beta-mannosidase
MALSGKSRKYKVKKVTNWSNNTSDVVIYSMITPSGGETTPPNYIRAFNTLTQLKTATSSAYMSELDVFLNKCGLTPSQITSFKSNAEVNDPSSCPTVLTRTPSVEAHTCTITTTTEAVVIIPKTHGWSVTQAVSLLVA